MSTVTTKYSVGDKVYIVRHAGLNAPANVYLMEITGIKIGGRVWETYEFGFSETRSDSGIWTDLSKAKEAAKSDLKEQYERNLKAISENKLDDFYVAEAS